MNNPGLSFVRDLTWEEAFDFWRMSEGEDSKWAKLARERGFSSWEEWRRTFAAKGRLDERQWKLYRIPNPLATVPNFRGGPFRAWVDNIYGDLGLTPTFAAIVPKLDDLKGGGARAILNSFPRQTTVIGVEYQGDVVIVEGMHRCSAIAIAAAERRPVETEFYLALGSELPGDLPALGGFRKDGTPA